MRALECAWSRFDFDKLHREDLRPSSAPVCYDLKEPLLEIEPEVIVPLPQPRYKIRKFRRDPFGERRIVETRPVRLNSLPNLWEEIAHPSIDR